MAQNADNIIPFKRPSRGPSAALQAGERAGKRPSFLHSGPGNSAPTMRKPQPSARDIALSQQLSAIQFSSPEQVLRGLAAHSALSRTILLRKEANLLARVMASSHRVFVLTPEQPDEAEAFYRQCYRLKAALDALAAELGRAALYNRGAFGVVFASDGPSGWYRTERREEQLRLNPHFSEQEVVQLFRPRLKPADVYEHELFDVGYRNS